MRLPFGTNVIHMYAARAYSLITIALRYYVNDGGRLAQCWVLPSLRLCRFLADTVLFICLLNVIDIVHTTHDTQGIWKYDITQQQMRQTNERQYKRVYFTRVYMGTSTYDLNPLSDTHLPPKRTAQESQTDFPHPKCLCPGYPVGKPCEAMSGTKRHSESIIPMYSTT